jgi:hypothetical protein
MKTYISIFVLLANVFSVFGQSVSDYIGSFSGQDKVTAPTNDAIICSVSVIKAKSGFQIDGSYAFSSGRSPSPDFSGVAYPSKNGNLYFKFTDSFDNSGEGSLSRKGNEILLNLKLKEIKDSRCAAIYIPLFLNKNAAEQGAAANP